MGITRSGQERFHYKPRELPNLEQVLSPERLASYKSQVSGNLKKAIKLHERNTAISSALYVPMQGVEVALRNSIHSVLSQAFQRQDWYDDESMHLLRPQERALENARSSLSRSGRTHAPGRIVAELPFGFWVGLTGRGYSRFGLWNRHLHKAFPNGRLQRQPCHAALDRLRLLRNRIAHHEPILSRDILYDHEQLLTVAGWICADTRCWIRQQSEVPAVVRNRTVDHLGKAVRHLLRR